MSVPGRRVRIRVVAAAAAALALLIGCAGPSTVVDRALEQASVATTVDPVVGTTQNAAPAEPDPRGGEQPVQPTVTASAPAPQPADRAAPDEAAGFTIAFAGDVNFSERTADRLAADPRDRVRGGCARAGAPPT